MRPYLVLAYSPIAKVDFHGIRNRFVRCVCLIVVESLAVLRRLLLVVGLLANTVAEMFASHIDRVAVDSAHLWRHYWIVKAARLLLFGLLLLIFKQLLLQVLLEILLEGV